MTDTTYTATLNLEGAGRKWSIIFDLTAPVEADEKTLIGMAKEEFRKLVPNCLRGCGICDPNPASDLNGLMPNGADIEAININDATLAERIKAAVCTVDPIGLLSMGAPADEYDPECELIATLVANAMRASDVRNVTQLELLVFLDIINKVFSLFFESSWHPAGAQDIALAILGHAPAVAHQEDTP